MTMIWIVDERDYDDYTFHGAFATGEYSWSHDLDNHSEIVHVAMMFPETL